MSFELSIERMIAAAIARGEFDDLQGKGKPLNLEEYFAAPEHLRMAYSVLKNAGCVPEEVEMLNEMSALESRPAKELTAAETARLRDLRLALAMKRDRRARRPRNSP